MWSIRPILVEVSWHQLELVDVPVLDMGALLKCLLFLNHHLPLWDSRPPHPSISAHPPRHAQFVSQR